MGVTYEKELKQINDLFNEAKLKHQYLFEFLKLGSVHRASNTLINHLF
jgi:hypothetical protein